MKVSVSRSRHNQFFALPGSPPSRVEVGGAAYRLVRVFKHDFFCATCLYELTESPGGTGGALPKIVVKFGRQQWFGPLPLAWYGRANARHEQSIYRALAGVRGVPRLAGSVGDSALAIEFIDSRPLDHAPPPPAGFFDRLRELFDAIHARGVAYTDSNKRSNILIAANGEPFLIDYQISLRRRDDWPWPLRTLLGAAVAYLQGKDLYHLYKHKRHLAPQDLTPQEEELSRQRGGLHLLHRKLTKPYRSLRRRFLARRFEEGKLISPTAHLEDHHQPEKETWRKP